MSTTTHHRSIRRGVAAAAVVVAAISTAACGSETASAPAKISEPVAEPAQGPESGKPDQQCFGSPRYAEYACAGSATQAPRPATPRQADAEGWIR